MDMMLKTFNIDLDIIGYGKGMRNLPARQISHHHEAQASRQHSIAINIQLSARRNSSRPYADQYLTYNILRKHR